MSKTTVSVDVRGLKEVQASLRRSPAIAQQATRNGLEASGAVFENELRARTPVKTGLLRSSVESKVVVNDRGGYVITGYGKQGHIARLVETGHRVVVRGKQAGYATGKHFMRRAFTVSAPTAKQVFEEVATATLLAGFDTLLVVVIL